MSKTQHEARLLPKTATLTIRSRQITITRLTPQIDTNQVLTSDSFMFDNLKPAGKIPFERDSMFLPATFRIEGFRDNKKPVAFILSLDYTDNSERRAVRISKIEAEGVTSLTPSLLKDIALDTVRAECLRLVAFRVRFFPAGNWDMANFPKPATEKTTWGIRVDKGEVAIGQFIYGADCKNSQEWALSMAGTRVRAWDSDEVIQHVARLSKVCPDKTKNRAAWISKRLEEDGYFSTRGTPFTPQTVNKQIGEARERKLIKAATRKKVTK